MRLRGIRVTASVPRVIDEVLRLTVVRDYGILDTAAEDCFDQLVRTAATLFGAPIGIISIADEKRMWFKARVGIDLTEMPREHAFCSHLVGDATLVIADATVDPRFRDSPFVVGEPHLIFYAGVPLTAPNGVPIGALSVLDHEAHQQPSARQMAALTDLAALAMDAIELRRTDRAAQETARIDRSVIELLREAHRGLLAAYRATGEFLVTLSHELRTPLNAVIGYAELIAGDQAAAISDAGRHMLALINDILEFSRLEAGEMPLAGHQVPLRRIIEEALRMVGTFAHARKIRLEQEITWPEAMVRGDPVRLKQILLNLLTNAIKFTPPGGEVRVRLLQDATGQVVLEVVDTGIGIAPDDIAKALMPFGQIIGHNDDVREGSGLGLPIAHTLVERHGGSLHINSELGRGTTVRVVLPAST
jgi:signal transduction histidine kinase